jgi:hypothetical protein
MPVAIMIPPPYFNKLFTKTINLELSTHTVNTLSMHSKDNKKIYITACSVPESTHLGIYSALGLNPQPIHRKKIIV